MAAPSRPTIPPLGVAASGVPSKEAIAAAGDGSSASFMTDLGSFVEPAKGSFHADFAATAAKMHPLVHRALISDEVDEDTAALVNHLGNSRLGATRSVLQKKRALSPKSCAALRDLVDVERDVRRDSVDHQPQHQLSIKVDRLTELIGFEDVRRIWRLADELLTQQREEACAESAATGEAVPAETATQTEAADGGYMVDLFVRRYTRETRPWINFHCASIM